MSKDSAHEEQTSQCSDEDDFADLMSNNTNNSEDQTASNPEAARIVNKMKRAAQIIRQRNHRQYLFCTMADVLQCYRLIDDGAALASNIDTSQDDARLITATIQKLAEAIERFAVENIAHLAIKHSAKNEPDIY